jgi:hypothetical protein
MVAYEFLRSLLAGVFVVHLRVLRPTISSTIVTDPDEFTMYQDPAYLSHYRAIEGKMAFLEWAYEDDKVRVRDGADSYLIENGKIVAQTIHYTVEQKQD